MEREPDELTPAPSPQRDSPPNIKWHPIYDRGPTALSFTLIGEALFLFGRLAFYWIASQKNLLIAFFAGGILLISYLGFGVSTLGLVMGATSLRTREGAIACVLTVVFVAVNAHVLHLL
jgi:hypothetical protein